MSRLMSVAYTEDAVRERRKTVTRRKNWWVDKNDRPLVKVGDTLTLCRKVMGRRKGEPLVRICDVEVVSVTREPLYALRTDYGPEELAAEGFPYLTADQFIDHYFVRAQGIRDTELVTRIEWRYLDPEPVYGMCTACGAVEVALATVTGTRDLSSFGEHPEYPIGPGCEVCA